MQKLKCSSCGANLKIDKDDKNIGYCEYCGSKYKLNEELKVEIKLDDEIKNTIKEGGKIIKNGLIIRFIVIAIIIISALAIFIGVGITVKNSHETDSPSSKFDISSFNSGYELYVGTESKFMVEPILDKASTNNKTGERKVKVMYGDIDTEEPQEIIEIKHSLKSFSLYEVSLEYDDDGYVSKIIIEDINK